MSLRSIAHKLVKKTFTLSVEKASLFRSFHEVKISIIFVSVSREISRRSLMFGINCMDDYLGEGELPLNFDSIWLYLMTNDFHPISIRQRIEQFARIKREKKNGEKNNARRIYMYEKKSTRTNISFQSNFSLFRLKKITSRTILIIRN